MVSYSAAGVLRFVVEDGNPLVRVHQDGQVALAADIGLVQLMDVAENDAVIADSLWSFAGLHDVQPQVVGVMLGSGREEAEVAEYLCVRKVVFQPVAHDGVGAKEKEFMNIMADLQPRHHGADNGRFAAARDYIEEDVLPLEQFIGVHRTHEGLFLMPPQTAGRIGTGYVRQEVAGKRIHFGKEFGGPPGAEVLLIGCKGVIHYRFLFISNR